MISEAPSSTVPQDEQKQQAGTPVMSPATPKRVRQSREMRPEEVLVQLSAHIEADGGMPGKDLPTRALHSALALLSLVQHRQQDDFGPLEVHVHCLTEFLYGLIGAPELDHVQRVLLRMALELAAEGPPLVENWTDIAELLVLRGRGSAVAGWLLFVAMLGNEGKLKFEIVNHG